MITTHVRTLMDDRANDPDNPLPATITVKVAVGGLIHECVKLIPAKETNTAEVLSELGDAYGQVLARVRESDPGSAHLEQAQQNLETPSPVCCPDYPICSH